jgi:thiol:disulfide interchange protein DsbD
MRCASEIENVLGSEDVAAMLRKVRDLNLVIASLCSLLVVPLASAQAQGPGNRSFDANVSNIKASFDPPTAARGQTVLLRVSLDVAPGWHTYPTLQTDPEAKAYKTSFGLKSTADLILVGDWKDLAFLSKSDPSSGITDLHYLVGHVEWTHPVVVNPDATPGKKTVTVPFRFIQVCDKQGCVPAEPPPAPTAELTITDAPTVPVEEQFKKAVETATQGAKTGSPTSVPSTKPPAGSDVDPFNPKEDSKGAPPPAPADGGAGLLAFPTSEAYARSLEEVRERLIPEAEPPSDLLTFVLQGIFWGFVSLITPCVFPMIPITVSFFLKQSEKQEHRPLTMAAVYCGTIVVVLTIAAHLLLSFFRALSVSPYMNLFIGGLFIFFALSLFGMYEIELPSGLARFTSAREGRGGLLGTMFMALTFTILSFACVAPFLGGFGGTARTTNLNQFEQLLGALAFAATFASPFFLLALFPSLLKKMPKSGSWLNCVKVVMGFLELAAAFKFLRLAELLWHTPVLFTYDFVLAVWVVLSWLCGLYLLGVYRLPHDSPVENLGVTRMLFSALFIGLGLYLLPALFKTGGDGENQRPRGAVFAWVDSFLLPEARERAKGGLTWTADLKLAIDESQALAQKGQRQLIFVDVTGKSCTNCKFNEHSVFSKEEFTDLLGKYKLVQLYTDEIPDDFYAPAIRSQLREDGQRQSTDARLNLKFQADAFNNTQLPLYVILEPLADGKVQVVKSYREGKINDEKGFAQFLKDPLGLTARNLRADLGTR